MKTPLLHLTIFLLFSFSTAAQTVMYQESSQDFMNPDRGFYKPIYTTEVAVLNAAALQECRTTAFTPTDANYQVRVSLIFRYYVLKDYRNGPIAQSFLNNMQADFEALRTAGMRVIPRFTYNIDPDTTCGEAACPPYDDVSKSRVLQHIAQIKPLLQANSDVISVFQLGFIGVWGEGYYTDYFGDASVNDVVGKITNANWLKRNEVLEEVLDAVPSNRMVQVRYPQLKQRYIYGIDAPVDSPALTLAEAHTGSDKSRIGFHNDCFLASADDYGTYYDYGNDNTGASNQIGDLKPYFSNDGKYVAVGGETCNDGDYNPENNCASGGGIAVSQMEYLHYSFLNADYNNAVNNGWQTGNCMADIKQRLGYRFVLQNGTYPNQASAGSNMAITMTVENVGFAAPFNERVLQLVLRNTMTNQAFKLAINGSNTDTRFWLPSATTTVSGSVALPANIPAGNYELLLHIADFSDNGRIANRPEYSIRLANQNMWETATGFNDLNHVVTISSNASGSGDCIVIDGNYSDWTSVNSLSTSGTNGLLDFKVADDPDKLYFYAEGNQATYYQLFIDSDNNNSGPNEYLNETWGSQGFNYMIENGELFIYDGTATDWEWQGVGFAMANKSVDKVELSINKSLFSSLAPTIRVGFSTLNGDWQTVGKIPNNSSGSSYTLVNQGCTSCTPDDLLLDGNVTNADTYATNAIIRSTQTLFPTANITYTAGNTIILKQGFHAQEGAQFTARIEACATSNNQQVALQSRAAPSVLSGISVYPNPFTDYIDLTLHLEEDGVHSVTIYDALGKTVATPFQEQQYAKGTYSYHLPLATSPQLLIVVLQSESGQVVKKVVRVR